MFITGTFSLGGMTTQRIHGAEFDDDVLSWVDETDVEFCTDGYISNVGSVVTIHIRPGYSEHNLAFVKKMFGVHPYNGVSQIVVVPFDGWEKELEKRDKED